MVYELEKEHKKTSLMSKKKEELVKEVSRLEHNVNVLNERLNVQASAIKQYEQESRNKAIDEFVKELDKCCGWEKGCVESLEVTRTTYLQVAEYLKGGD